MRTVKEIVESKDSPWKTESAFWTYIRGGLRLGLWNKHPLKIAKLHSERLRLPLGRKTEKNPQGLVWGCVCETCKGSFRQSEVEVDHIDRAGVKPLQEDLEGFIRRLGFILFDDLAIICKPCHKAKSYAEKQGISFEDAVAQKKAIDATKKPVPHQKKELTGLGFPDSMLTNEKNRRKCYVEYFKKQSGGLE